MKGCRKCGSKEIRIVYHEKGCERANCSCARCGSWCHAKRHDEHLHYFCQLCAFDWTGDVLA